MALPNTLRNDIYSEWNRYITNLHPNFIRIDMTSGMVIKKMQFYRLILQLYNLVDHVDFTILFGMIYDFAIPLAVILWFTILPFEFQCHLGSLFWQPYIPTTSMNNSSEHSHVYTEPIKLCYPTWLGVIIYLQNNILKF